MLCIWIYGNFRESRIRVADFQRQCCSYSQPISSSAGFLSVLYHVRDGGSCLLSAGDVRKLLPSRANGVVLSSQETAHLFSSCWNVTQQKLQRQFKVYQQPQQKFSRLIFSSIQQLCLNFGKTVTPSMAASMVAIFHFWSNFHKSYINSSWHVSERWNCWLTYLSFLFQTDFTTSEKCLNVQSQRGTVN